MVKTRKNYKIKLVFSIFDRNWLMFMKVTIAHILFLSCILLNAKAQTLHTILVADTYDNKIGESCRTDFDNMKPQAAQMAKSCGYSHKLYSYKGGDFDKHTLLNGLNALKVGEKDVVLFFYAGHGVRNNSSKWPKLVLENGEKKTELGANAALPLTEVQKIFNQKGFRFSILITDCCNNSVVGQEIAQRGFRPMLEGASTTRGIGTVDRFYQSLLINTEGSLLVSSSSPEEEAVCYRDKGGLFTNSLLQVFERMSEDHPKSNWDEVMNRTKQLTSIITLEQQTPIWELQAKATVAEVKPKKTKMTKVQPDEMTSGYVQLFLDLANNKVNSEKRLKLIPKVLEQVFASPEAVIEIYGRNGRTRVGLETAEDFVNRLFTSTGLVSLSELGVERDSNSGKITKLKLHETYQL